MTAYELLGLLLVMHLVTQAIWLSVITIINDELHPRAMFMVTPVYSTIALLAHSPRIYRLVLRHNNLTRSTNA